jgi:tetratricopeptide (TPR) repeat protein
LAQALLDDENYKDADVRVRRALKLSDGDQQLQLDGLVLLTRAQLGRAERKEASETLSEIKRRLDSLGAAAPVITQSWVYALDAAIAIADELLPDKGVLLLDKAIQLALLAEGPLSGSAVTMRLLAAHRLVKTADPSRSVPYLNAAIDALRRLGGAHAVRAAVASAEYAFTAKSGGGHGSFSQAIAELERCVSELSSSLVPVPKGMISQVQVWIGDLMVDAGNVDAGLKLEEIHAPILKAYRDNPRNRQLLGEEMGGALALAGQHEAAERWYLEKLEAVQQLFPNKRGPIVSAYEDLFLNRIYWGHLDDAESAIKLASREVQTGHMGSEPSWASRAVRAMQARLYLSRGEAIQALSSIRDSRAITTPFLEGEALCAAGQPSHGLSLLQDALGRLGGADWYFEDGHTRGIDEYPHAPWAARRRSIAGLCAVAVGDRATALRFAAQARSAFVAQPQVSPYFKAPLIKLERALGLKLPPV